jgi:hypothetical protein
MRFRDLIRRWVTEAPAEDAVCEFRCRKAECRHSEWAQCDYRLRGGLPADLPASGGGPAARPDAAAATELDHRSPR